ncbi:hypothetical protein Tco_0981340, partial [Tanacetum coccineum]
MKQPTPSPCVERAIYTYNRPAMGFVHGLSMGFSLTSILSFQILLNELSNDIMEVTDTFCLDLNKDNRRLVADSLDEDEDGVKDEGLESKVMRECCFVVEIDAWLRDDAQEVSDEFYRGAHFLLRVASHTSSTPIKTNKAFLKDEEAKDVDVQLYRLMIGSLMYLIASRPDIIFVVCARVRLISWQCKKQTIVANSNTEAEYVAAANCCGQTQKPRKAKRTIEISQFSGPIHLDADETVYKEWEDIMERAATTAFSLEAEQDSGNINRTQSIETLNESFPQGTDSCSGPRCQDTILGGAEAQIRFKAASKPSNDPPLSRVNTLGSGKDIMKLKELMELCTKLSERILDNKKTDRVN